MKHLNKIFLLLIFTINVNSYAAGGPDAYGYTWLDSNDPGGPVYSWVDISTIGTEIIGLGDDNSVPFIPMGLSFGYYWIDYTEIKVGSNGWLSFNDVDNLATCFSNIPTNGGSGDNFVAPFLFDLDFGGVNNPSRAYYYHDSLNELFIVSFIDVPYYRNNAAGFIGSNTFQVIFAADDKSITIQYNDIDHENYQIIQSCANSILVGMENVTGSIGFETHKNVLPEDNYAIKITYPEIPLIDVIDPAPIWNQKTDNTATLIEANQDIELQINVANKGNADTIAIVDVTVEILDESNNIVYSDLIVVNQLLAQQSLIMPLPNPLNLNTGRYHFKTTTTSTDDLVLTNNSLSTELNVVDTTLESVSLGHTINNPTSSFGALQKYATFFETPTGGWIIDSVSMFVRDSHMAGTEDYRVSVYANDGGDNLPGTLLATELVEEGTYPLFSWVNTQFSNPVIAPSNGFFVAWERVGVSSSGVGIGFETLMPPSRLAYTYFSDGTWTVFRDNQTHDFSIDVELTDDVLDTIFTNGFESQ